MCSAGNYWWQLQCSCKWLWQWDLWIQQLLYFLMRRGLFRCECLCRYSFLAPDFKDQIFQCGRIQRIKHHRLANLQLWTSDWMDCWQGEERVLLLCSSHLYRQCVGRRDFFSHVEDRAKRLQTGLDKSTLILVGSLLLGSSVFFDLFVWLAIAVAAVFWYCKKPISLQFVSSILGTKEWHLQALIPWVIDATSLNKFPIFLF